MMNGLGIEAARQLGRTTTESQRLQADAAELKQQKAQHKEQLAAMAHTTKRTKAETDQHATNRDKLLHAINELNCRNAHLEEEVRLLEEEKLNLAGHVHAAKDKEAAVVARVAGAQSDAKECEAERQAAEADEERVREEAKALAAQRVTSARTQKNMTSNLKRIQVSSEKCNIASQYVEALMS